MAEVSQQFHRAAITAQQSRSISFVEDVIGRDGISMTTVWKKYALGWELRRCGNVPSAACQCRREGGVCLSMIKRRQ
jgi:hypothetical protein